MTEGPEDRTKQHRISMCHGPGCVLKGPHAETPKKRRLS